MIESDPNEYKEASNTSKTEQINLEEMKIERRD